MSNATWLRQYAASGGRKGCSHEMADELKEAAAEIERLRETVALMEKRILQLEDMDDLGYDLITCGTGKLYADGGWQEIHHAVYRLRSDKGTTE